MQVMVLQPASGGVPEEHSRGALLAVAFALLLATLLELCITVARLLYSWGWVFGSPSWLANARGGGAPCRLRRALDGRLNCLVSLGPPFPTAARIASLSGTCWHWPHMCSAPSSSLFTCARRQSW